MIEIFPTSRCVRDFYSNFLDKDMLLPKTMGIAEFESKVIVVPNKSMADDDSRVLIMQEASAFENFSELKIEREFLSFIKNSTYLFRFFEELALEKVGLEELESADTYAEFNEHLSILKELLLRYKQILSEKNLFDKITLPELYELNEEFLKSSSGFLLHLEGFLNRFELELFLQVAQICEFKISLHVTSYNQKMVELFESLGISLHVNNSYIINLTTNEIEEKKEIIQKELDCDIRAFSLRSLQSAFVYEKIEEFVKGGIIPENIAVIVPEESFATTLKAYDSLRNLNFAMGESFTKDIHYKKLDAIDKKIRLDEFEHKYRIQRLKIEKNIVDEFQSNWRKSLGETEIISLLRLICDEEKKSDIYEEEIFNFSQLLKKIGTMEVQKAIKLFLNRLASKTKDDVMGGKVTVMGPLESRGMSYEGVIIVDFSDEFVPKRSQKDMFLNSTLRTHANLPNRRDRENLQRYFYSQLIRGAKKVAISFTKNDQSMGSRFLEELGLHVKKSTDEVSYFAPMFQSYELPQRYNPETLEGSYDLSSKPLSASQLKTVLTCKRQFYYKHIMKSKEVNIPNDDINEAEIGNLLHKALCHVLKEGGVVEENTLMIDLRRYLLTQDKHSIVWNYHVDIWLEYLKDFASLEAKRYNDGYRVFRREENYKTIDYKGFKLGGIVDRVDIKDDKLSVIDYKSGKIPESNIKKLDSETNFQLEFYYLLTTLNEGKKVENLYYYNLKKAQLVEENIFEEKLKRLDEVLEELKRPITKFEKCESNTPCKWCPYVKLCGLE